MATPEDFDRKRPATEADRKRELAQAGNALVEWFNTQEINKADAEAIMSKVMAKLILARTRHDAFALSEAVNDAAYQLVHDMNDRLHAQSKLDWRRRNG